MKVFSLISIVSAFLLFGSFKPGEPFDKAIVRKQAEIMGNALVAKNYKEFARYVHPRIIAAMGGEDKMIAHMAKSDSEGAVDGFAYKSVKFEDPGEIVDTAGTLQCTLKETIDQSNPDGHMTTVTHLIGISMDNGAHWYFIDIIKDTKQLKAFFKELSSRLDLTYDPKTEFYNNGE